MTTHPTGAETRAQMNAEAPARYEIVVKDRLSSRFDRAFPGVEIAPEPGRTVLTGEFQDQSQLHGLLDEDSSERRVMGEEWGAIGVGAEAPDGPPGSPHPVRRGSDPLRTPRQLRTPQPVP